jgi:formate-dependent nitrite reductase membrane component NrfD
MIPPPHTHDGRNLDPRIADEHGEGATIAVERPDVAWPLDKEPQAVSDTYYDLPVVKAAPWKWYVPAYFYLGGLGGAAATMIPVMRGREARRLHWIASIAEGAGAACLITDLGKPLRFINMMRVFRPTSPMNMGTWILTVASAAGGVGLLVDSKPVAATAAVAGSMLSTYTGVLLGNTAVPVWNASRRRLPLWFAASSAASLASLLEVIGMPRRRYSLVAKTAEIAGMAAVEHAAASAGVAAPLHEGRSGKLWSAAKWLGVASLAATALRRNRLAGVLGTASAVLGRYAIVEAGKASAADPHATFEPQRGVR